MKKLLLASVLAIASVPGFTGRAIALDIEERPLDELLDQHVPADGLNVRTVPNGYPVMSLVNGTPFYPLQKQGDWLLVAPACDLTPTWAWSWNAGVPLNRCWVYF
jgi:hypothetical protein